MSTIDGYLLTRIFSGMWGQVVYFKVVGAHDLPIINIGQPMKVIYLTKYSFISTFSQYTLSEYHKIELERVKKTFIKRNFAEKVFTLSMVGIELGSCEFKSKSSNH